MYEISFRCAAPQAVEPVINAIIVSEELLFNYRLSIGLKGVRKRYTTEAQSTQRKAFYCLQLASSTFDKVYNYPTAAALVKL